MVNPAKLMKIMSAKNKFGATHPKFMAFIKNVICTGVEEGTVIEVTVTKPGMKAVKTNLSVKNSDRELFDQLKDLTSKSI